MGKKIKVCIGSNSGCGVSNGSHGARTSVASTIIIEGVLDDCSAGFICLKDTTTVMLSQIGVDTGFSDNSKLNKFSANNKIISIDKILFVDF